MVDDMIHPVSPHDIQTTILIYQKYRIIIRKEKTKGIIKRYGSDKTGGYRIK